ncbi:MULTISPECIES: hypothetical protein [Pseudomonas]|jgi:hypothetical protein|uniref:Uncharacterized protein n=1 Tax=Pseudomonas asgharzadehiana TaxID=2842349 RepID=A0ABX8P0A8_9PSED|nr:MULTISPECIES: hypothetical protein [Pseudomonas]QXH67313.1 hypothetical protein KSS96_27670 [Pseudomonas asgharzadehiana]
MNLKGKQEVTYCSALRALTQGVCDLARARAEILGAVVAFLPRTTQQKAIVLPVMALIMPRPVSAKGNFRSSSL